MPGTGGATAWANVGRLRRRQQRRHARLRHALRRRHRRRRLRPRGVPGGRLHAGQPLALRQPRLLVRRRAPEDADRLARALARPLRLARQPAPGGLARLQLSKQIRSAKAPVCAMTRPHGRRVPRGQRVGDAGEPHRADGAALAGPGGRGQRRAGRARASLRAHGRGVALAAAARRLAGAGGYPNSDLSRSCSSPRRCCPRTSARRSSRSTGAPSTPTATRSRARTRSSRRSRGRWPPSRPTSPPAASRRTS